jgi:ATP-binding cassette, subfamily C, type I secretion system permease/ATPase
MTGDQSASIPDAFRGALKSVQRALVSAGIFSLFSNILMLAGPLYMLQIYDRVLTSQSMATLIALTVLLIVLYVALGFLEGVRGQILNRLAGRLDRVLGPATLEGMSRYRLETGTAMADEPLRDLAALRHFLSGPGLPALFDVPWTPLFLALAFVMHWTLGVFTLLAAGLMMILALMNEASTKSLMRQAKSAHDFATRLAIESGRNNEAMVAMGMTGAIVDRWRYAQDQADKLMLRAGDRATGYGTVTRTLRLFLQSGLLGVGAVLAIEQIITPGMMIAASIIGGRALAPVGQVVSQWRGLLSAREAYSRLKKFHSHFPPEPQKTSLPPLRGSIEVRRISAGPPDRQSPVLKDISFKIESGTILAVLGPSAAGKSTLARVLLGLWQPHSGSVCLDGADIRLWNRAELGRSIGYLPQSVELFDGTVAQNIARFYPDATASTVQRAAKRAGVHEHILELSEGYDTRIGEGGSRLSSGQRQRIGLARAIYGDPSVIILDEPNANLDLLGEAALQQALASLKASGTTVILITHRPSVLESVDFVLMLDQGQLRGFGPTASVVEFLSRPRRGMTAQGGA